ncbi:glutamate racemase [Psychromonas sp. PT13]|uniref:glutamate racemase n=1 Tax=Psychromonas sp. PT13 TaxID=3439547 RepID=UPI003EBEE31B
MTVKQVLIFDSGVGGLSVYQEIIHVNPNINSYYLFDNACFPYGELEDDFLINRLTALLLSFVNKHPVDLIVIACNSASTVALDVLRSHLSVPIVGVVPAIKPAAQLTKNAVIGLLATPATIHRHYTVHLIEQFAVNFEVLKIGSTELVKLAENKLHGLPIDVNCLNKILAPWLSLPVRPDIIVLGCTHFPLLKEEIAACFQHQVTLVDSGKAIAHRVSLLLAEQSNNIDNNQHIAFYTKSYSSAEKANLQVLQHRFKDYGFTSLSQYKDDPLNQKTAAKLPVTPSLFIETP